MISALVNSSQVNAFAATMNSSPLAQIAHQSGETVGMAIWDDPGMGDGLWYRVQVQRILRLGPAVASVRFIDFGNMSEKVCCLECRF